VSRDLHDAVAALFTPPGPGPYFGEILWDAERHALSFRGHDGRYVNVWLNRPAHDARLPQHSEHFVETNGGPGGVPEVLWTDGQWADAGALEGGTPANRAWVPTVPPDVAKAPDGRRT
jgi:hypothetical protein